MTGINPGADDVTDTSNEFFDTPKPSEPRLLLTHTPYSLDCGISIAAPAKLTVVDTWVVGYARGSGIL